MTDQPRDLAAEVERIVAAAEQYGDNSIYSLSEIKVLLLHIADQSSALHGAQNDAKSMELQRDQALRDCAQLREALRWALENGVYAHDGIYYWPDTEPMRATLQPPAHLAPILAEAMRSKL